MQSSNQCAFYLPIYILLQQYFSDRGRWAIRRCRYVGNGGCRGWVASRGRYCFGSVAVVACPGIIAFSLIVVFLLAARHLRGCAQHELRHCQRLHALHLPLKPGWVCAIGILLVEYVRVISHIYGRSERNCYENDEYNSACHTHTYL